MFNQNQKLVAPQEYFHFSNRFAPQGHFLFSSSLRSQENNVAQEKLVAHSGFMMDAHAESVQNNNEQITFGYWFWHGGFLVAISYLIIVLGTGVFIKYLFSLLKKG
jgi:hypothetical protein